MKTYTDKNGTELKVGDHIQYDGETELHELFACGDGELGISATNPAYLKNHPDAHKEFYPLPEHSCEYQLVNPNENDTEEMADVIEYSVDNLGESVARKSKAEERSEQNNRVAIAIYKYLAIEGNSIPNLMKIVAGMIEQIDTERTC